MSLSSLPYVTQQAISALGACLAGVAIGLLIGELLGRWPGPPRFP